MKYEWLIDEFEKEGNFYRGPNKAWELRKYGFYPQGLGDLIYNTLRKILEERDKSPWAYEAYYECRELLRAGKRWPDYLVDNKGIDRLIAKNRLDNILNPSKYRWQKGMTRDPWVMFYCCSIHLDMPSDLEYKPQWWLYRPKLWSFRRALIGKWNAFGFWFDLTPAKQEFVKVLDDFMIEYYIKAQSWH